MRLVARIRRRAVPKRSPGPAMWRMKKQVAPKLVT